MSISYRIEFTESDLHYMSGRVFKLVGDLDAALRQIQARAPTDGSYDKTYVEIRKRGKAFYALRMDLQNRGELVSLRKHLAYTVEWSKGKGGDKLHEAAKRALALVEAAEAKAGEGLGPREATHGLRGADPVCVACGAACVEADILADVAEPTYACQACWDAAGHDASRVVAAGKGLGSIVSRSGRPLDWTSGGGSKHGRKGDWPETTRSKTMDYLSKMPIDEEIDAKGLARAIGEASRDEAVDRELYGLIGAIWSHTGKPSKILVRRGKWYGFDPYYGD